MAEELVTGPEGLIVFQGAESLQVRVALRAAKRPKKKWVHIYSSTHTCKGHRKDKERDMKGTTVGQSHTCTHRPQSSRLSVAVSSGKMRVA